MSRVVCHIVNETELTGNLHLNGLDTCVELNPMQMDYTKRSQRTIVHVNVISQAAPTMHNHIDRP